MTAPRGPRPGGARPGPAPDARVRPSSGVPPTARGAVLVGILVIAGIVGLQILDDSGTGSVSVGGTAASTASTAAPTATSAAARPPSEVRVKVYNASGVDQAAQAMSDKLKAQNY